MNEISTYIKKQVVISFIANLLINGALTYWIVREQVLLQPVGDHGYVRDILLTALLLSWLFSWINLLIHRRKRQHKELPTVHINVGVSWLPSSLWLTAVILGVLSAVLAGGAMLVALTVLFPNGLEPAYYAILKGAWTGIIAAILIVLCIAFAVRPEANPQSREPEVV